MTSTTTAPPTSTVSTPTLRQTSTRWRFWVIAGAVALVIALFSLIVTGAVGSAGQALSPTDAGVEGGKALAEVLSQNGVNVTTASSMAAVRAAEINPSDTTIFVADIGHYLDGNKLQELARLSSHLIVMTPDFDQLEAIAPSVALAGSVSGVLSADCALRPVVQANTVTGTGSGYRSIGAGDDVTLCLGSGDDVFSLVQATHSGTLVTVLGTVSAFSNQFVINEGNAAFALGLLGDNPNLVWLSPTIDEAGGPPTAADLTPEWVSVVMVLLIIVVIAAGFWRGRRFGPLVVENLPVVVRSSETMHGRARLYEKSSARLHALDALRIGTLHRLGTQCGLPTSAEVDDVIRSVAALLRRPEAEVAGLLRDADTPTESDLVRLSDALLELEKDLARAIRPSQATIETTVPGTEPGE